MAENSKIEWTDHTFNPWTGCTKVSPGCANCYAEGWAKRSGHVQWGPGKPRRRTSPAEWRKPVRWNAAENAKIVDHSEFVENRRPRVFCASLADWLDDEVPIEWLADLLALIHQTPNLDWLLLTKRPQNWERRMRQRMEAALDPASCADWINGTPPSNVWIGTTVEDQTRADERIPHLLSIPAKVRFLSCEPLLGPVDLTAFWPTAERKGFDWSKFPNHGDGVLAPFRGPDWVIAGGESGPGSRPMHPEWARSLRDQCVSARVPFLFKQWGEWAPSAQHDEYTEAKPLVCMKPTGETSWWAGNEDTAINYSDNYKSGDQPIERIGKARAGRILDGREWNEFPEVNAS